MLGAAACSARGHRGLQPFHGPGSLGASPSQRHHKPDIKQWPGTDNRILGLCCFCFYFFFYYFKKDEINQLKLTNSGIQQTPMNHREQTLLRGCQPSEGNSLTHCKFKEQLLTNTPSKNWLILASLLILPELFPRC